MVEASTKNRETHRWTRCCSCCSVLLVTLACADVLGIPGAPRLIDEAPPAAGSSPQGAARTGPELGMDPGLAPSTAPPASAPAVAGEGVVPAAGLDLAPGGMPVSREEPPSSSNPSPAPEPPSAEPCVELSAPVDLILMLDNSGSMAAETAAVERALLGWSQWLAALGLDYRLILLSRHRTLGRAQSEAASTSICVEQPLSGLASCPSAAPVPGERFFHYSIKLDASDSLERALESFSAPDPAGLAPAGWSQWLRPAALQAFIEISDADSELPAAQFAERLGALAPEHFTGSAGPGFLFYSVVGVAEKALEDEPYLPEEPIESEECRSADTNPDNAGQQYQALSIETGGLRFSLCRIDALGNHLERIAEDVLLRARRCVADEVPAARGSASTNEMEVAGSER